MRARCHIPLEDLPSAGLILTGLEDLASDRTTPASLLVRIGRGRLLQAGVLDEMPPLIPLETEPGALLRELLAATGQPDAEAQLMSGLREFLLAVEARHAAYLREVNRLPVTEAALLWAEKDYPPARQRVAAFAGEILRDQLGIRLGRMQPDSRFAEDLDMKTLEQIETISSLRETMQLPISDSDAHALITVRDLINCLCLKLGARVAKVLSAAA